MVTYSFQGFKGRAEHRFTCPACKKANRVRSFTVEHTVNPFNTNEDGSVRTPSEVRQSARAAAIEQRDQFARAPLCATCEGELPYAEKKEIWAKRKAEQ